MTPTPLTERLTDLRVALITELYKRHPQLGARSIDELADFVASLYPLVSGLDSLPGKPAPAATAAPAEPLREGDEVWVRGEVSVIEEGDDWIEVDFDSATGHEQLSFKTKDILKEVRIQCHSTTPSPGK
jgi:hypothetical protein